MALLGRDTWVRAPSCRGTLLLETLSGTEELGVPYVFHLGLLSEDPVIDPDEVLGKPLAAGVRLATGGWRCFQGMVTSFAKTGTTRLHTRYAARLNPFLSELAHTSDCRVFNETTTTNEGSTVPEVAGGTENQQGEGEEGCRTGLPEHVAVLRVAAVLDALGPFGRGGELPGVASRPVIQAGRG